MFSQPAPGTSRGAGDGGAESAPVVFWLLDARQAITAQSLGAPMLPTRPLGGQQPRHDLAVTVDAGRACPFRLEMTRDGTNWLVAGQSRTYQAPAAVRRGASGAVRPAGPVFRLPCGGPACAGPRRAATAPPARVHRRRIHELRTPLSVISAETEVALCAPRDATGYRDALVRIQRGSTRLRQLVDDMLWLARFDSRPTEHGSGTGLGLAIGNSIVRSTGGRWRIGDSPLGGALMMVTWKRNPLGALEHVSAKSWPKS